MPRAVRIVHDSDRRKSAVNLPPAPRNDRTTPARSAARLRPARRFDAAVNAAAIVGFVLLIAGLGWYQRPAPIPAYTVVVRSYQPAIAARRAQSLKIALAPARPAVYPCGRVMTQAERRKCIVSHLQAADRDWSQSFRNR